MREVLRPSQYLKKSGMEFEDSRKIRNGQALGGGPATLHWILAIKCRAVTCYERPSSPLRLVCLGSIDMNIRHQHGSISWKPAECLG